VRECDFGPPCHSAAFSFPCCWHGLQGGWDYLSCNEESIIWGCKEEWIIWGCKEERMMQGGDQSQDAEQHGGELSVLSTWDRAEEGRCIVR
jgi:hypothetical protein